LKPEPVSPKKELDLVILRSRATFSEAVMSKEKPALPAYNRSCTLPTPSEQREWLAEFEAAARRPLPSAHAVRHEI
jgi:hypothetical protein